MWSMPVVRTARGILCVLCVRVAVARVVLVVCVCVCASVGVRVVCGLCVELVDELVSLSRRVSSF